MSWVDTVTKEPLSTAEAATRFADAFFVAIISLGIIFGASIIVGLAWLAAQEFVGWVARRRGR